MKKRLPVLGDKYNLLRGAGEGSSITEIDQRLSTHEHIYQSVMGFEDEGSLLRLLAFETPVIREERVLFGQVKML